MHVVCAMMIPPTIIPYFHRALLAQSTAQVLQMAPMLSTTAACATNRTNDNATCTQDCSGVWGGAGVLDNCGVCDSDPLNDNLTCQRDCNGIWGGGAVVDVCNICGGDGSTCTDCAGVPYGTAFRDLCGTCVEGTTGLEPCDCALVQGGDAFVDGCERCVGGTTGRTACPSTAQELLAEQPISIAAMFAWVGIVASYPVTATGRPEGARLSIIVVNVLVAAPAFPPVSATAMA